MQREFRDWKNCSRRRAGVLIRHMFYALILIGGLPCDAGLMAFQGPSAPEAPLASSFRPVPEVQIRESVLSWLSAGAADEDRKAAVQKLWMPSDASVSEATAEELVDRVVRSCALADPEIQSFLDLLTDDASAVPTKPQKLTGHPLCDQCLKLYLGRWLTQHRFYDEALEIFLEMNPEDSIDPAGLFFYRAVCQRELNLRQEASESLTLLLKHTVDVPARFRAVAEMLSGSPDDAESDGLPAAARVMSDVQRRLDLGRSGEKVRQQEEEVISILDKLLADLEKKNQQQGESSDSDSDGGESEGQATPAGSSQVKGSASEGEADRKDLDGAGSWGLLDAKTESRARELIRQNFPPNYLDAISRYTRKLAEQK
jgi:hypothetical protein